MRSSLTHSEAAAGRTCTRSISLSTQYLPIRIPWLIVKRQPGEPFTSHKKACSAQYDHRFFGTKPGEDEQGIRGLEYCREHQQREYEGSPALRILHATCGVLEPLSPR